MAWIGMGLGSYQAGYFYDLTAAYLLPYGNAALAGLANLAVTGSLFWYRNQNSRHTIAGFQPRPT
jgi:hypothetical protein